MSTNGPGEEKSRTPAPAGRMSRIFSYAEAGQVGMSPWQLEYHGQPPPPAPVFPEANPTAPASTAPPPKKPEIDYEARLQQLQQQHQRDLEQAAQRARAEAEARAQSLLQTEVEPWLKRMAQSIEDIATVRQRFLAESEEQVVRLSIAIARRILYREIQVDTEALFGLIHAATQRADLRELNRILLNPKDHQALLPHLERMHLPPRVEIVSDPALERGALLLESTSGILDASIQAQLDEVERGFIDLLGRRS